MRASTTFSQKEVMTDEMRLKATAKVDAGLMEALIDKDEGLMRPGALPKLDTSTAGANKQLMETLTKAPSLPFDQSKPTDVYWFSNHIPMHIGFPIKTKGSHPKHIPICTRPIKTD